MDEVEEACGVFVATSLLTARNHLVRRVDSDCLSCTGVGFDCCFLASSLETSWRLETNKDSSDANSSGTPPTRRQESASRRAAEEGRS